MTTRRRRGITHDPCPGCGSTDGRATNAVCPTCRALIADGRKYREHLQRVVKSGERVLFQLPDRGYATVGYFDVPAGADGAPDPLVAALGYHTITGLSPRGDWQHVVVGRAGQIEHDPHPEGGGLRDRRLIGVFVRTFDTDGGGLR